MNILKSPGVLSFSEDIIMKTTRRFCRNKLMDMCKRKAKVVDIYKEMGNIGILGPLIKGYNCMETNYKMYGLMAKEIEYIDSGYRSLYSVQSSLVMNPIYKYGTDSIKEKYLERLASGEFIGCFGLTEPDSGSDAGNMSTTAELKDDCYVLNGVKTWITNSPIADVMIIWAKLNNNVAGFVVDRSMNGVFTPPITGKMSLLSSDTGIIYLNDVIVPKENRLNIIGMRGPLSCLNDARLGISFGVLGAAEFCMKTALDYSKDRKLFGSPLSGKQLFQSKMADMITEYNLGLLSAIHVADKIDNNESCPEMISLIKRNNCYKSLDIVRTTRDMLGGNGITEEYNIFRHLINLETVKTYEGTHDIHGLILGKYITGLSAF